MPKPSAAPAVDPRFARIAELVARWQKLQNDGNFAAYSQLYAPSFRGLKRVGDQTARFDKKRWLVDRKPMFVPGLRVGVKQLEFATSGANVVAVFRQDFETPAYRDSGRKLLAFAPNGDGFHIVREEMLSSEVRGGGGSVSALPGFFYARPDAVVLRSAVEDSWLTPARRALAERKRKSVEPLENGDMPDFVEDDFLKPDELNLPPEVLAYVGKTLYVTRVPRGARELPPPCQAQVTRVVVRNTAKENFEGSRNARGLDHLYGSVVLGLFDKPCPDAVWAAEQPPPKQYLPKPASSDLVKAARKLTNATSRFPTLTSSLLGDDEGKSQFLFLRGSLERENDDPEVVDLLFELKPTLRLLGSLPDYTFPRIGFDLDGDGVLEILAEPQDDDSDVYLLQSRAGKAVVTRVYSEPEFVCHG